ncbi:hypothetical protein H0N96_02495 [Candidatus Micrarchaeota archaeon]|nr:hypothetical protein [Candidatus Micrarchaeota archaeon]
MVELTKEEKLEILEMALTAKHLPVSARSALLNNIFPKIEDFKIETQEEKKEAKKALTSTEEKLAAEKRMKEQEEEEEARKAKEEAARKAITGTAKLAAEKRMNLIALIEENPTVFFKTVGKNVGFVARFLGEDLKTLAERIDLHPLGAALLENKSAWHFGCGAGEHLNEFAKGAVKKNEIGRYNNKLRDFALGAVRLRPFRFGAGEVNYQRFLKAIPKEHRNLFKYI